MLRHPALIGLLLLLLFGGGRGTMQVVAWTGMAVSYSVENGLGNGLQQTFSGERPCELCIIIQSSDADMVDEAAQLRLRLLLETIATGLVELPQPGAQVLGQLPCPHAPWALVTGPPLARDRVPIGDALLPLPHSAA